MKASPPDSFTAEQHTQAMNRRHFLRGLGACIALPSLASLVPSRLLAAQAAKGLATTATGAPLRTAFVYFPNGAIPASWWPEGGGSDFRFGPTLEPLAALKNQLQVVSGLDHANAKGGKDGAGDHARGNGVFLTGVRLNKSATEIRAGISIDQVMAGQVGHLTRFPSLELTCDVERRSGSCDSGYACAYQHNLSWRSATTPMPPESNPRLLFERMFGGGAHGERAENARRRMEARRSVLDFVNEDTRRMQGRLDAHDRDKLDQYLTGIRDVEIRIGKAEQFGPNVDPDTDTPAGVPRSHGDHVRLQLIDRRLQPGEVGGIRHHEDVRVATKLRTAVQHARLAAHQQRAHAIPPDRRKDFEDRAPGQANLPVRGTSATVSTTPPAVEPG